MYADDLILLSESETGLQKCLDKLNSYTKQWKLKINIKKTKIMIFQKGGHLTKTIFRLGDQIVEKTKEYKYLGTIITYTGNFKLNEVKLKKKGQKASYLISKNIGLHAKPSTSIKIFEKIVEPILMYNCEISHAYMPKTWNYEKFKNKLWETGGEVNKVVLSFLRQLLGLHKKSPTLTILAETGKYPLSLKIFTHIIKYWIRLHTTENSLLIAAKNANLAQERKGNQNWLKLTGYLLKYSNISSQPSKNAANNNKLIKSFKQKMKKEYETWWRGKMQPEGSTKFDFFYKYKKTFEFEDYLDNIPRHIRLHTTRLRTSSHNLPVETMRYADPKPDRKDRKCRICNMDKVGDEHHYLLECSNFSILDVRKKFMDEIKKTNKQLESFDDRNIIDYCMVLNDKSIQEPMTKFIKQVLTAFKEEQSDDKPSLPTVTRSGRTVKAPQKLNL